MFGFGLPSATKLPGLSVRRGGVAFDLLSLDPVYLLDTSNKDTMYLTNAGSTKVSADGDTIGTLLEVSQWGGQTFAEVMEGQPQLVSNPGGPFTTSTGWSDQQGNAPLSVVSGALHATPNTTAISRADTPIAVTAGQMYRLEVDVAQYSGAGPTLAVLTSRNGGLVPGTSVKNTVGTIIFVFVPAATGTVYLTFGSNASTVGVANIINRASIKAILGAHSQQATSAACQKWYGPNLVRFDGIDDRHTQTLKLGATGFILFRRKLLSKIAGTQVMYGVVSGAGTDRLYFGHDASGYAIARVGDGAVLIGADDLLDVDGTQGVFWNGTTAGLIVDGEIIASQAQVGAPTTTVAPLLGGFSNNGTPGSYCKFDLSEAIICTEVPTVAQIRSLHTAFMAA